MGKPYFNWILSNGQVSFFYHKENNFSDNFMNIMTLLGQPYLFYTLKFFFIMLLQKLQTGELKWCLRDAIEVCKGNVS